MRRRILRQRTARAPLLDAAIPRTHVLADVAAVDLGLQLGAVLDRRRRRRLRPVGETARRVECSRLVESARRASVDAEPALAAVEAERRGRLELGVRDERPEHDPGAVPARDQERVLAVEADAAACSSLAVDVLVCVDEDPVRPAQPLPEHVELLPQLRVRVEPRVARQAAVPGRALRLGQPVAERRRHDGAGTGQQRLGMARLLGPRHREAHVGEEAAGAPLADVALGAGVGLGRRDANRVEPELLGEGLEFRSGHADSVPRCARFGSTRTEAPRCSCSRRRPIRSPERARCSSACALRH